MGKISKGRDSHITNTALTEAQGSGNIILPIFGTNFQGHGVTRSSSTANRFAGESEEGWGFHANGTVDCIDITRTRWWQMGFPDGWATFYGMEVLPEEIELPNPAQSVISRLVVTINTIQSHLIFLPDPILWAVQINQQGGITNTSYGLMCLRPAYQKEQIEFRKRMALRRKSILENCL